MSHQYKVGMVVHHREDPTLQGVIVGLSNSGMLNHMSQDIMIPFTPETSDYDTKEEHDEPWYRIKWFNQPDTAHTPTYTYNGQESEGQLIHSFP